MRPCPSCGEENPDKAKFCLECATPLPEQPARATREERKTVSIVFCDLVGFTEASEQADPEDVRARLIPYHERVKRELEALDGTVEKFIGDAVMAVFGAPVTHEDDAERAVRASLRILEAIEEMNAADPSLRFAVRIAVNSGETLVALDARPELGEAMVTGDVVNTASRLQGAAPVGSVIVSEPTYVATERVIDYEPLEPVVLKGKSEPERVWRAITPRARFGSDLREHTTPLAGRKVEATLLEGLFERAVRDGSIQLVTLVGEPGVGKSRLVWELARHVDDLTALVRWRQGRCLPYGDGVAFWALGEIVKADAGILDSDDLERATSKLDRALADDLREREWMRLRLLPLIGIALDQQVEQEESFTAWRKYVESLAADGPAVLVFEDLHWADASLISFLHHLAERSDGYPILLVCTARPELYDSHPGWADGLRNATRIDLALLSPEETGSLVTSVLGETALPAEVVSAVLERTGGNPLYVEETVRALLDAGLLKRRGASWALAEGADAALPDNVQALIAARIDTLDQTSKRALQDAAVIGKMFWLGAVAALGGRDPEATGAVLRGLGRRDFIRRARDSSVAADEEFMFLHQVVREVAYGSIPRLERATKHLGAAAWIEDQAGERVLDVADLLAHHATEALSLAVSSSAHDVAEDARHLAARTLTLAAQRALSFEARRARQLAESALELMEADEELRATATATAGRAAMSLGDLPDAKHAFRIAIDLLNVRGRIEDAAQLMLDLARVEALAGDVHTFKLLVADAIELLEGHDLESLTLARAYRSMASDATIDGKLEEARVWIDRARSTGRALDRKDTDRLEPELDFTEGTLLVVSGDEAGLELQRRGAEGSMELGDISRALFEFFDIAIDTAAFHGFQASLGMLSATLQLASDKGRAEEAAFLQLALADAFFSAGRWDECLEAVERLKETSWWASSPIGQSGARVLQGQIAVLRGARSTDTAENLIELVDSINDGRARVGATALVCTLLKQGGRDAEARAALRRIVEDPDSSTLLQMFERPGLVRSAVDAGDLSSARFFAEGMEARRPIDQAVVRTVRAVIAESDDGPGTAAELYREAQEQWLVFDVLERGLAFLGEGRCLLRLGRPEGTGRLAEAREIFASLGARVLMDEVDGLAPGISSSTG